MYEEKKKEYQDKLQEERKKAGVFFAFNDEQFEENRTHKDVPGNEYTNVGHGIYIHKLDEDKYLNFINNIRPKLKEDFLSNINMDNMIKSELKNHECYYSGDVSEVCAIVNSYYDMSHEDIYNKVKSVYMEEKQHYKDAEEFIAPFESPEYNNKRYNYMLLSRLKSDCEYFLNNKEVTEKYLWAGNVESQIAKMRELWNSFSADGKPEWLTSEEIDEYEQKMMAKINEKEGVVR